ncbi:MAG: RrF2 family transcriptional regulator [Lachnospiraceae bacterium]|nr:RrF2 family transcriptional regulator [Lachnospiraceae bacterium]MBP3611221.1 RrF2 family transcriptional regulator [Lachnospiraceae bacterium]
MKLTTKGRYGLRAVIDLAVYAKEEPVSLAEVAERQSISISYLEQLVAKLKKAGIVQSTRGAQGGYSLAKEPEEISVGEILRALEGNLSPVDCSAVAGEGETECASSDFCVTKYVWKRISDSINDTVNAIFLSELMAESEKVKRRASRQGIPEEHVSGTGC